MKTTNNTINDTIIINGTFLGSSTAVYGDAIWSSVSLILFLLALAISSIGILDVDSNTKSLNSSIISSASKPKYLA